MSGTLKIGGKTLATHNSTTNVAKIQLGSADDVVITDSSGNSILSESGSTVTLTADGANIGSNALVVDSSGNVGVGTSSPSYKLNTVIGAGESNGVGFLNASGQGLNFYTDTTASNADVFMDLGQSGASLIFNQAGSEKMRIDSSGNVGIGTSSSFGGILNIQTSSSRVTGITSRPATNITYNFTDFQNSSGTGVGGIGVTASSTVYSTSSDYRLKENITEITDGISRVKQLNPSRFNFIVEPDNTVDGFIAHEVSDIVPEAVNGEKDAVNEDGSINPQGIDQSKLVPLLTAALQESIALIESQQSQIDVLTARIEALEATP